MIHNLKASIFVRKANVDTRSIILEKGFET